VVNHDAAPLASKTDRSAATNQRKKNPPEHVQRRRDQNRSAAVSVELGDLLATARADRVTHTLEHDNRDDPEHSGNCAAEQCETLQPILHANPLVRRG
jgi:hypothetical protein